MKPEEKLKELKVKGIPIYSFSKLGTFHNCPYEYYKIYILGEPKTDSIYTIMGNTLHKGIEGIYLKQHDLATFKNDYENKLLELNILGIDFPSDIVRENWIRDVSHFIDHFKVKYNNVAIETLILFQIDGIWLQGYVDLIVPSEKGLPYVNVIDWKTSSQFTGKKTIEAGRQLIMYKLGIESTSKLIVDKVMWNMIKYLNVCWKLKNGKIKKKLCNRGTWVKQMRSQLEKDMVELDLEEFEKEFLLDEAVEKNSIDHLPQEIRDKYWLEDGYVEYEITDDKIEEFKEYVKNTVQEIESKTNDSNDWKAIEIDKSNSFYCAVLCSQRKNCPFYRAYLENNDFNGKDEKEDNFSFKNLFR